MIAGASHVRNVSSKRLDLVHVSITHTSIVLYYQMFTQSRLMMWEANCIPTDTIPTNAILTKVHVDGRIIMLYIHIHQKATILRVM